MDEYKRELALYPYLEGEVWVYPEERIGQEIVARGIYEPTVIQIIRHYIKRGFSFIDIGANIGLHTLAAAFCKENERQEFVAFEPEANCHAILELNCYQNSLSFVSCVRKGIAGSDGQLPINISITYKNGDHSFLPRPGTIVGQTVNVTTLDTYFLAQQHAMPEPVLLKIDVEGYEIPVLQGGLSWFHSLENVAVIVEVSPYLLELSDQDEDGVLALAHEAGFCESYVINDIETFEKGIAKKKHKNMLFLKGKFSSSVNSEIPKICFVHNW